MMNIALFSNPPPILFVAIILVIATACSTSSIHHRVEKQDWANLERYRLANSELRMSDQTDERVVFMGNSITEFWSHYNPNFFADNNFINRGISAQTTPQMLVRFRSDAIDLAPEIVVILAGTNDIAGNTGPTSIETIMGNIKSMAEIARSNQIKVIISSVLPAIDFPWSPGLDPSGKIMSLNQLIEGYCTGNGFVFLNYYSSMVDEKGGLKVPEFTSSDDLVHPNERGYKVMEELALPVINDLRKAK